MPANDILFLTSTRIQSVGTTHTEWFSTDMYEELIVFLELSDQGNYTDETLDITVQVRANDGGDYDIANFDQITNKTMAMVTDGYYRTHLPVKWFGTQSRIKIVTAGASVDYTLTLQGIIKRT